MEMHCIHITINDWNRTKVRTDWKRGIGSDMGLWETEPISCKNPIQSRNRPQILVPLLSTKTLEDLPLHVQKFQLRMMRCKFSITYVPWKELNMVDVLSKSPLDDSKIEDTLSNKVEAYIQLIVKHLPSTDMIVLYKYNNHKNKIWYLRIWEVNV